MPVCYHNQHGTKPKDDIMKANYEENKLNMKKITPDYVQHSLQENL